MPHKIIIIGAGITGLSAAHRLLELQTRPEQLDLKLLEGSDRAGGTISTIERDGFLVEQGPVSFLSAKPWLLDLCKRIDLTDRVISTNAQNRRAYIVYRGRLHPLPDGFLMMAPTRFLPFVASSLFSWPGKLRMALDLILPRAEPSEDESLASFVRRRLGREALERVAQPLIGGIYTGDPENLSLRATMPLFLEMEEKHGSVIKAMWHEQRAAAALQQQGTRADSGSRYSMIVSFDRGMQTIVDALISRLPADSLFYGKKAMSVQKSDDGWQVTTDDGFVHEADDVMIALPSYRAARLLKDVDQALAQQLSDLSYASSAIVNFAFNRSDIPYPLEGFGFVVQSVPSKNCSPQLKGSSRVPVKALRQTLALLITLVRSVQITPSGLTKLWPALAVALLL